MSEAAFPYDLLARHGVHPGLSAQAVHNIPPPLERAENLAWRTLRQLAPRLATDFFLYQVHDHRGLSRLQKELAQERLSDQDADLRGLLEEDAPVILLLMDRRGAARKLLEAALLTGRLPGRACHRLALMSYAEAQCHEEAGEHAGAGEAWRRTIAYWVGSLADDGYWETWCRERQRFYGTRAVDVLDAGQREAVREELRHRLASEFRVRGETARRQQQPDRARANAELELLYVVEWKGAEALRAAGGLSVEGQPRLVCGPLLLRVMALEEPFGQFAACLPASEALKQLRRSFSQLAVPAALIALNRPGEALEALGKTSLQPEDFVRENPAYARLDDRALRLQVDAAVLAMEARLAISRACLSGPQSDLAAVKAAWREALARGREAGLEAEAAQEITELCLGRARALRRGAGEGTPESGQLDQAVTLLEAAQEVLPGKLSEEVTRELAERLCERGALHELHDRHEPAYADLHRALALCPDNAAILNELCTILIYWALDCGSQNRTEEAQKHLETARNLAEAALQSQSDGGLRKTLAWAKEELEVLHGAEPGRTAWEELDRLLQEHGRSGADQQDRAARCTSSAETKRGQGDYPGAVADLEQALAAVADYAWAREEMRRVYRDWAQDYLSEGQLHAAGEVIRRARARGFDSEELRRLEQRLRVTIEILGEEEEC